MGALRLRIDKYLDGALPRPPQVYASIHTLGESGVERASPRPPRQELIPVSHAEGDATTIALEPGRYYVEVVLPSGEILADDVEVVGGQTRDLVFRPEYSPREWLSWQHLVGNVQSERPRWPPDALDEGRWLDSNPKGWDEAGGDVASDPSLKLRARSASKGRRMRRNGAPTTGLPSRTSPPPEVKTGRPLLCLSPRHPRLSEREDGRVWDWLADLSDATPSAVARALYHVEDSAEVAADVADLERGLFSISSASAPDGAAFTRGGAGSARRYFAAVRRRRSLELLCLPIPWVVVGAGREADIEIVVQQPADEREFCSAASARDEQLGMILGYLSSGSLPAARRMVLAEEETLFGRFENPFAAAAGAYALVGTAHGAAERGWHGWIHTLMREFPHIPDGAIQWGQLRLRMRRDAADIREAKAAFKLAYRRGLPFYSTGMRWLLSGLEWAAREDEEAAGMLENVRRLAMRTHYQQPFTILRLGGEPGV